MTEEAQQRLAEKILARSNSGGYFSTIIGASYDSVSPHAAEGHFTAAKAQCNPYGIVHGGVYYTLLDQLTGMAVGASGSVGVTIDTSVSYLTSARIGDTVRARVECVRLGRSIAVYEGKCWGEDGTLQCMGTFHLAIRGPLVESSFPEMKER